MSRTTYSKKGVSFYHAGEDGDFKTASGRKGKRVRTTRSFEKAVRNVTEPYTRVVDDSEFNATDLRTIRTNNWDANCFPRMSKLIMQGLIDNAHFLSEVGDFHNSERPLEIKGLRLKGQFNEYAPELIVEEGEGVSAGPVDLRFFFFLARNPEVLADAKTIFDQSAADVYTARCVLRDPDENFCVGRWVPPTTTADSKVINQLGWGTGYGTAVTDIAEVATVPEAHSTAHDPWIDRPYPYNNPYRGDPDNFMFLGERRLTTNGIHKTNVAVNDAGMGSSAIMHGSKVDIDWYFAFNKETTLTSGGDLTGWQPFVVVYDVSKKHQGWIGNATTGDLTRDLLWPANWEIVPVVDGIIRDHSEGPLTANALMNSIRMDQRLYFDTITGK